jgi:hypothetical protein
MDRICIFCHERKADEKNSFEFCAQCLNSLAGITENDVKKNTTIGFVTNLTPEEKELSLKKREERDRIESQKRELQKQIEKKKQSYRGLGKFTTN